jgi:hypothetical protein
MRAFADCLSSVDLEGGELEPRDVCLGCEADVPAGVVFCPRCQDARDDTEVFELSAEPRRI